MSIKFIFQKQIIINYPPIFLAADDRQNVSSDYFTTFSRWG